MNILLGITGGIAAYKAPDLVRRLRDGGADVQIVMTTSAEEFVTETTLQAVSGRPLRSNLWDKDAEAAMSHIELARWADVVLIAPEEVWTVEPEHFASRSGNTPIAGWRLPGRVRRTLVGGTTCYELEVSQ